MRFWRHIQTSGRSLHAQEIQFNDIRTTLQALYALFDNCNSLHTNAYDEAITTPTEESVRRAVAIQLIINRELGLNFCENPWQGSCVIDRLTDIVEEAVLAKDDAYFEFTFGSTKFLPRYGNVFRKTEAVTLLCAIYGAAKDEAGKISVIGGFQIVKDGKTLAKAPDQTYEIEPATPSAGPVPLGGYAPGKYVAQLRLRDNVAKKDYVKETEFEIIP